MQWSIFKIRFSRIKTRTLLNSGWFKALGFSLSLLTLAALFLYRVIPDSVLIGIVGLYLVFLVFEAVLLAVTYQKTSRRFVLKKTVLAFEVVVYVVLIALPSDYTQRDMLLAIVCLPVLTVNIGERLVKSADTVYKIMFVGVKMTHILSVLLIVIFLIMYVYIICGMEGFSGAVYTTLPEGQRDFDSFWIAALSVFQMVTGEGLNELLDAQYKGKVQ